MGALALAHGSAASAQAMSGSETRASIATSFVEGGGRSLSSSFRVESGVGQATTGSPAASASFRILDGVVAVDPALFFDEPIVFGTQGPGGGADGGELVKVVGFNFKPSPFFSSPVAVTFAGVPATSVQVVSNNVVRPRTPPGRNAFGNPLGSVALAASTSEGTFGIDDGFVYQPALIQGSVYAFVGAPLVLRVASPPGALQIIAVGLPSGGGVPIFPFVGALELAFSPFPILLASQLSASGLESPAFPIPPNPNLAGVALPFQALAVTDLVTPGGSFSNLLTVTVLP